MQFANVNEFVSVYLQSDKQQNLPGVTIRSQIVDGEADSTAITDVNTIFVLL